MVNIIMLICILWILPFLTGTMWWQEKKKDNLVMGVRIPKEHIEDAEFVAIRQQYKKRLVLVTVLLFPIPFAGFLIPYDSICFTLDMFWLLLVFLIPYGCYVSGYHQVKEIKREKAYGVPNKKKRLVDTKAASVRRKTSHFSFACASVVSFLPVLFSIFRTMEAYRKTAILVVLGSLALCTPVFWVCCYMMLRTKAEILSDNSTVNENFARMKARTWDGCMQFSAWTNTVFVYIMYLLVEYDFNMPYSGNTVILVIAASVVYCAVLLYVILRAAGKVGRIRARIIGREKHEEQEEDDDYWIWGSIYYNPDDTHSMVEKRVGTGTTINLATGLGKGIAFISIISILLIPVMCVWMLVEEFTPVRVFVQPDTVVVSHLKKEYEIAREDISSATLIEELPPRDKIFGTNMTTLEKGTFDVEGIGDCEFCLNPEKGPYLVLDTEKKKYIFSDADEAETRKAYEAIMEK